MFVMHFFSDKIVLELQFIHRRLVSITRKMGFKFVTRINKFHTIIEYKQPLTQKEEAKNYDEL